MNILVEVTASGNCHTDFEVLKHNYGTGTFLVVPGHEYAGVVVETIFSPLTHDVRLCPRTWCKFGVSVS
jgi:hypothetical protein